MLSRFVRKGGWHGPRFQNINAAYTSVVPTLTKNARVGVPPFVVVARKTRKNGPSDGSLSGTSRVAGFFASLRMTLARGWPLDWIALTTDDSSLQLSSGNGVIGHAAFIVAQCNVHEDVAQRGFEADHQSFHIFAGLVAFRGGYENGRVNAEMESLVVER
jgi:hypothetical protein